MKFEAKRQADKDMECEEMRYPLEQQLLALEAKYPEFIVSKAELKKRQVLIHISWVILCLSYFFLSVLKLVNYFLDWKTQDLGSSCPDRGRCVCG